MRSPSGGSSSGGSSRRSPRSPASTTSWKRNARHAATSTTACRRPATPHPTWLPGRTAPRSSRAASTPGTGRAGTSRKRPGAGGHVRRGLKHRPDGFQNPVMASDLQRYGGAGDWSCCALVLVDESAEDLAALYRCCREVGDRDRAVVIVVGWPQVPGPVRAMPVIMRDVLAQDS